MHRRFLSTHLPHLRELLRLPPPLVKLPQLQPRPQQLLPVLQLEQLVVLEVDHQVVELVVVLQLVDLPAEADPEDQAVVKVDQSQPSMLPTRNTRTVVVARAIVGRFGRRSG
jgi:hypothetical protein